MNDPLGKSVDVPVDIERLQTLQTELPSLLDHTFPQKDISRLQALAIFYFCQ